jgi:hypothetical protein
VSENARYVAFGGLWRVSPDHDRTRGALGPRRNAMSRERQRVSSGSPFEATIGYARAVRVGDRVLVSGTAPIWPDGSVPPLCQ